MTSLDFNSRTTGNCFAEPAPAPCTLSLTVAASSLGITPGNGLYNIPTSRRRVGTRATIAAKRRPRA